MGDDQFASMDEDRLFDLIRRCSRFAPIRKVGSGGMADVIRVRDSRLGVERALKVIKPGLMQFKAVVSRFLSEARAMSAIHHINTVQVFDIGDMMEGDQLLFHYIVLEWCGGGSLDDHITLTRGMPSRQAVATILDLCKGLSVAHDHHPPIYHRDIKPDNILLSVEGIPKLADFGIARFDMEGGERQTITNTGMGSYGYMPPEQYQDASKVNAAYDIHALAMTLWHMITGRRPDVTPLWYHNFQTEDGVMQCAADIPVMRGVPDVLIPVLRQATRVKNEERYQTLGHFTRALIEVFDDLPANPPQTLPLGSVPHLLEQATTGDATPAVNDILIDGVTPGRNGTEAYSSPPHPRSSGAIRMESLPSEEDKRIGTLHETQGEVTDHGHMDMPTTRSRALSLIAVGALLVVIGAFTFVFFYKTQQDRPTETMSTVVPLAVEPALTASTPTTIPAEPRKTPDAGVKSIAKATDASTSVATLEPKKPTPPVARPKERVAASKPSPLPAIAAPGIVQSPPPDPPKAVTVRVGVTIPDGDPAKVWVVGPTGRFRLPSQVPMGSYKVVADFEGRGQITVFQNLSVTETTGSIQLRCNSAFANCTR